MLLNCGVGEDSWESLRLQKDQTSQSWRKSVLNIHWKDWCWSWSSWCKEPAHWKRPWCWERLKMGGEGDHRGGDFGWHRQLNGHECKQALRDGEGQGSLMCCSQWGHKELDTTQQLTENSKILEEVIPTGPKNKKKCCQKIQSLLFQGKVQWNTV